MALVTQLRRRPSKGDSRRQFLRGAGVSIGIPFLSSIATPRGARADVIAPKRLRFFEIYSYHGGVRGENFFPSSDGLTGTETLFPGHNIRFGAIPAKKDGTSVVISKAVAAPAQVLTDRLLGQINMYRGFNWPFWIDHNGGGRLGNPDNLNGEFQGQDPRPTIDQVLGWSKTFYDNLDGIRQRTVLVGSAGWGNRLSYNYASPQTKSGGIVLVPHSSDPVGVFNSLFKGFDPNSVKLTAPPPSAKPLVDLVLEDFKRLRDGNLRLSTSDKQRLSDHMEMLNEVERKVSMVSNAVACGNLPKYAPFPDYPGALLAMWVDIVAAAVKCGLTRIASINQSWPFVASYANYGINTEGTWHQGVAHTGNQELLSENLRNIFAYGVLLLAQKLDVEESGGRTFLDNSLIIMTQECGGELTHQGADYSTLTVGSAGGFFKTGQYFDLRRMDPSARWTLYGNTMGYTGPMYNQLLAIILQSMGLPRSEFEVGGQQGYGRVRIGPSFAGRLVPDAITQASRMIAAAKA